MATEKIIPNKPLLIMLYGYPGSGKTQFVRQLVEVLQAAHVHADRMRYELFDKPRFDKQETEALVQLMNYMSGEFLSAGMSVIYDMNVMRAKQRHELRELARKHGGESLMVWVQLDTESAFSRVASRDRRRTDDRYAMPLDRTTFDKFCAYMQNPLPTEEYVVISGKHVFKTQFGNLLKRLHDLKLVEARTLQRNLPRPALVNLVPKQVGGITGGRYDPGRRNLTIR